MFQSPAAAPQSEAVPSPVTAPVVSTAPKTETTYPDKLVRVLGTQTNFGGMRCGLRLSGEPWHKSKMDGIWSAILNRAFGENEVSCLLESEDPAAVQTIELEAEFYRPGYMESEMLMQFSQSAQVLMYPAEPPAAFAEAVANKREWSNDEWQLSRVPYQNGGFGLMLCKIKK